ncbi:MAG: glycosyltransferase family 2 protein [Hasllibacter sp.]
MQDMPTRPPAPRGDAARPDLLVSIINYETEALTIGCLASAMAETRGRDARIVVVDNRSRDGSADAVEAWIDGQGAGDRARLIRSKTNSGFSGGHNQAMAACPARHVLLLNSDAVLRPGCVDALLAAAAAEPRAGLFAPRIEHEDGAQQVNCFRFHGPASELVRGAQTGLVTRLFARGEVALEMPPDPGEIDWASFACILLRGAMVEELGPMDEGYFLYYEDAEYCLRARRAGWRVAYVPEARMVHYRGGSGPVKAQARARKRLPPYYYASRTRFLYQAHGAAGLWGANLAWLLGSGVAAARRLARLGGRRPTEGEARDIWTNALRPLGERRGTG